LSRITAFADRPLQEAVRGVPTDPAVIRAVRAHPCCSSLPRAFGCALFGRESAYFNVLHAVPVDDGGYEVANPEDNQPLLYYGLLGMLLRSMHGSAWLHAPQARLLLARLLGVLMMTVGAGLIARQLRDARERGAGVAFLLVLLLPGASESLVRCSNDVGVFFWAAVAVVALTRRVSPAWFVLLAAIGPLLKLTAVPVVVVIVVTLLQRRERLPAFLTALASLLVVPAQLLRGWRWGGTVELNRAGAPIREGVVDTLLGLVRSAYTVVKTAFWLGNWSFFRPPRVILLAFFAFILLVLLGLRPRRVGGAAWPHLAGVVAALAGLLLFAVAHRLYWGTWGGVGGWYLWAWTPWFAVAGPAALASRPRWGALLLGALAALVVISTAAYFLVAVQLYGAR
jgi:hypothetical protein